MTRELDPLLERIDRVVAECDARSLPPLASGTAAAAIDLVERLGHDLTPWQEGVVRAVYADPEAGRKLADPGPRPQKPPPADPEVWPEPTMVDEGRRPRRRRWWSR